MIYKWSIRIVKCDLVWYVKEVMTFQCDWNDWGLLCWSKMLVHSGVSRKNVLVVSCVSRMNVLIHSCVSRITLLVGSCVSRITLFLDS